MGERCNDVQLANMWEYGEKSPRKGFISDFCRNRAANICNNKKTVKNGGN
ncbi:MAG: hypothetical protein HFE31_00040 [Clostridia bacterium]|nr:hypothetical protein [Clostridia bacterium]